jgi:O-antigen ligase
VLFLILGEDKFFKVVSLSVVIVSTLFSIIGILEVFQIKFLELPAVVPPGSTLGHRSYAAEYLLSSLPFMLLLKDYLSKEKRIYLVFLAIINVSFLLFTRNRSGFIILTAILLLYILYILSKKEKGTKLKILTPVLGVIVISFLFSLLPVKGAERPDIQSTAATIFDTGNKSNMLRLKFWEASLQMIEDKPITGVGLFKWSGFYPKYDGDYFTNQTVTQIHSIHAHNDFLELFTESGAGASLIFLMIYITVLLSLLFRIRKNEKYFYLLLTFLITAAYSLVAFPNHKFASFFLACIVAGTAFVGSKEKRKFSLELNYSILKWTLLCFMIIGGITSYIKLKSENNFGEAMYLMRRAVYPMMYERLEKISEIFYPFDTSKQPIDYYRGIANSHLGNYSEALKNNLSGQELAPYNPTIMRNIANNYSSMKKFDKAVEQLERVKKNFPDFIAPQINLLELYSYTGQIKKADNLYLELKKKAPNEPLLLQYESKYKAEYKAE